MDTAWNKDVNTNTYMNMYMDTDIGILLRVYSGVITRVTIT